MKDPTKLTAMERLFAYEYVVDLNATKACARAGFSEKSAYSAGPRLLTKPRVKAFIDELLAKRERKLELSADLVVRELMRVGFVDIGNAYGPDGQLLALTEMPEDTRRAIAGVDSEQKDADDGPTGEVLKVKFNDKLRALELLGKHLKLFTELHEHKFDELSEEEREARIDELLDRARARRAGQAAGGSDPKLP